MQSSAEIHPFLTAISSRILLGDGAMGTMLYSQGIYLNRCYDALNLDQGSLVEEIHREYLAAGSEIIETNTFGANRLRLKAHGLEDQVISINRAGVEIAKKAIAQFSQKSLKTAWIAGSIGPLGVNSEPFGILSHHEARAIFREQAKALAEAGVDIFMLETFTHLRQLQAAIEAVREISTLPIVAMMTVTDRGTSILQESAELMAETLAEMDCEVIGLNCSTGPSAILEAVEVFRTKAPKKKLAVFPNAGVPKQVQGRYIYLSTPEYFGSFAKKFATVGVHLIGGCCGTTPLHIKRARDSIAASRHLHSQASSLPLASDLVSSFSGLNSRKTEKSLSSVEIVPIEKRSRLSAKVLEKKFVVSVELDPPKGTELSKVLEAAKKCYEAGVDCINIADGPRASARMSPMSMAVILEPRSGYRDDDSLLLPRSQFTWNAKRSSGRPHFGP